jgi:hypothetical protein
MAGYGRDDVGEEINATFGCDERSAMLGAEHEVKDEVNGSVRQVSFAPSELVAFLASLSHGLHCGLQCCALCGFYKS